MRRSDLIRLYPRLFHMAADGAWPSIERHGLLSTAAIVERWGVASEADRAAIVRARREELHTLEHPEHGTATIRDQKPIHEPSLAEALDDMAVADWYETLNSRVFFFLQERRVRELLGARSYRADAHTVLTLDTARLVDRYGDAIELCAINSGFAQRHAKARRGRRTFLPVAEYAHPERTHPKESGTTDVAELTVPHGVPDIREFVIAVDRVRDGEVLERLVG